MDQTDEIPLFSIIFKSQPKLTNGEEGDTDGQIYEDPNFLEDSLSSDNLCANETKDDDESILLSTESNSRQNADEESEPHLLTPNEMEDQTVTKYLSNNLLTLHKESENGYETEEVSSEELSFDEEILGASNLVSNTGDFEVYKIPLSSVFDILNKSNISTKKHSTVSALDSEIGLSEYKKKLRAVKLRRAKYRKKIRMLEDECEDLQQKLDSIKSVLDAPKFRHIRNVSSYDTLGYFDMESDDSD